MELKAMITKVENEKRLKAYATLSFDRCFLITDIKILDLENGLYVAMPNKKRKNGVYRDVSFPMNREMREKVTKVVLDAYNKKLEELANENEKEEKKND